MSLLEKVKEAGIIGAGGAGFPTHVKLNAEAEYILLNGAECEPLLRVDQQIMDVYADEIITGLYLAGKQVKAKKAIIGVKVKHTEVISKLRQRIEALGFSEEMEVGELPDVYPAGDEQVLVYELTGRVVPELGIPIQVGCVVINSETALNIFKATTGEAVLTKYVTIAGDVPKPQTYKVPVGTPLKELIARSGREDLTGYEVVDGGPMMGPLAFNVNGYVTKKTKGLVILPSNHSLIAKKQKDMRAAMTFNKTACEGCRLCTDLCPRYLLGHGTSPHKMVRAMSYRKLVNDEDVTVSQTCCQCNLCEYFSCPAGINPKMANMYFMVQLRNKGIKHKAKDHYEARRMRSYKMIPSKRLIARIDLTSFDKPAPLVEDIEFLPEVVGISLNAHVGAGATPVVQVGDKVKKGQVIGEIPDGAMGARAHSSIDGTVEEIRNGVVVIRRD